MKNLIMFFVLIMVMVFSSYEVSYSQETGNFYFLIGTEGNERAIMYLHIEGERAYGSYYTESQSIYIIDGGFNGSFDGKNLNLTYRYYDNYYDSDISIEDGLIEGTIKEIEGTITGTLSGNIVFRGKHNSKNINLSLAKTPVNSARIVEDTDDYFSGKKFTFNVRTLNNLDSYDRFEEIAYLDENIIIFSRWRTAGSDGYFACSIDTGKEINPSDFISNSFLKKNRRKNYSLEYYSFCVTPNRKIVFFTDLGRGFDEEYGSYYLGTDFIEFTFEELKPFIKRGSPLDYLFN